MYLIYPLTPHSFLRTKNTSLNALKHLSKMSASYAYVAPYAINFCNM